MTDYTPTTDWRRHDRTAHCCYPRERLGEPRPIKPEAFDRWLEQVKQEARAEALADAGFLARPLPTREETADELSGWPIGTGYDQTTVSTDEAREIADAVLALLKGQTDE